MKKVEFLLEKVIFASRWILAPFYLGLSLSLLVLLYEFGREIIHFFSIIHETDVKADDNLVAALCLGCHYEIDQGKDLSRQERQEMWLKAHQRTIDALRDCWPIDIPFPDAKI